MTNIQTTEPILLGIPAERKLERSRCLGRHSMQCSHNGSQAHRSHFISLPDEILLCLLTASGTWLSTVPTMPITFLESANHSSAVPKEGTENLNRAQELAERMHYILKPHAQAHTCYCSGTAYRCLVIRDGDNQICPTQSTLQLPHFDPVPLNNSHTSCRAGICGMSIWHDKGKPAAVSA